MDVIPSLLEEPEESLFSLLAAAAEDDDNESVRLDAACRSHDGMIEE